MPHRARDSQNSAKNDHADLPGAEQPSLREPRWSDELEATRPVILDSDFWSEMLHRSEEQIHLRYTRTGDISVIKGSDEIIGGEAVLMVSNGSYQVFNNSDRERIRALSLDGFVPIKSGPVTPGDWIALGDDAEFVIQVPVARSSLRRSKETGVDKLSESSLRSALKKNDGEITIGRSASSVIQIRDQRVSRTHLRIALHLESAGIGYAVDDSSSTNGSFYLNSSEWRPIAKESSIPPGSLVSIGHPASKLIFRLPLIVADKKPEERNAPEPASVTPIAIKELKTFSLHEKASGKTLHLLSDVELTEPVSIGRDNKSHIHAYSVHASRVHAEVQPTADGKYLIRDLDSRNGSYVWSQDLQQFREIVDSEVVSPGSFIAITHNDVYRLPPERDEQVALHALGLNDADYFPTLNPLGIGVEIFGKRAELWPATLVAATNTSIPEILHLQIGQTVDVHIRSHQEVSSDILRNLQEAVCSLNPEIASKLKEITIIPDIGAYLDQKGKEIGSVRIVALEKEGAMLMSERGLMTMSSARRSLERELQRLAPQDSPGQRERFRIETGFSQAIRVDMNVSEAPDVPLEAPMHASLKQSMFGHLPRGEEALDALKENHIRLIAGLSVGDAIISFTNTFEMDTGRVGTVAIVEKDGRKEARVFYMSNSEGVFRLLPAVNQKMWYMPGYDKSEGEEILSPPSIIQEQLARVCDAAPPVPGIWGEIQDIIVRNNEGSEEWIDYNEMSIYNPGVHIRNEMKRRLDKVDPPEIVKKGWGWLGLRKLFGGASEQVTSEKRSVAKKLLDPPELKMLKRSGGGKMRRPEDISMPHEHEPDYRAVQRSYSITTNIYGELSAEVYPSRDGSLEYIILRDRQDHAWFGHIGPAEGELNRFGTPLQPVDGDEMVAPLAEYYSQVPYHYQGKAWGDEKGRYCSNWPYLKRNPHIRAYYEARGLQMPNS